MNDLRLNEYQASGKFSGAAVAQFLFSIFTVIVVSILYSVINYKLNIDWITPVILMAYVWFLTATISRIIDKGKVRSSAFGFIFGGLLGTVSVYISWAALAYLSNFNKEMSSISYFMNLGNLLNFSDGLLSKGWFDFFGVTLSSNLTVTAWIVEAIALIFIPALFGFYLAINKTFCESCEDWLEKEGDLVAFYFDEPDRLKSEFLLGSYGFMEEAKGIFNVPTHDYFVLESELCVSCNDFFTFRLKKMLKESDLDKAKASYVSRKMVATRPYYQHISLLKAQFPVPEED